MSDAADDLRPRTLIRRLGRRPGAVLGFALIAILAGLALLAPVIAPQDAFDPAGFDVLDAELPPFWASNADPRFVLGTDAQGRDLLSAILYGARVSLTIGLFAVLVQATIGVALGVAAGYLGGWLDGFLMRLADVQLALSTLMVAIIALALFQTAFGRDGFGASAVPLLVVVIGIAEWPQFARTARAAVQAEKRQPYVLAAEALGLSRRRIVMRHILPNAASPLIVVGVTQVANAVTAEAALSFLGLGMPVSTPSLGTLIRSGFDLIFSGAWWVTLLPGGVLVLLLLSVNMLGDGLRDALDPRLRAEP